MANRMAAEREHHMILSGLTRIAERTISAAADTEKDRAKEDAKKKIEELLQRARKETEESKTSSGENVRQKRAKEWAEKSRSQDQKTHESALEGVKKEKYVIRFGKDGDILRESIALEVVRDQAPDWLREEAGKVIHSEAAAEFVAQIVALPKDLQEDPYVLYREAARLYWSTDWDGVTNEARKEVRAVLDRTFEKIGERVQAIAAAKPDDEVVKQFGIINEQTLMQGIDRRFDLYRTRRLDPLPAAELAGKPPIDKDGKVNKKVNDYISWLEKKTKEVQRFELEKALTIYQLQMDRSGVTNLEAQRGLTDELLGNLRAGLLRSINVDDVEFDVKYTVRQYNLEAQKYIDLVQKQHDVLQEMITMEREAKQQMHRREQVTISWKQLKEMGFINPERADDDTLTLLQLSEGDIKMIFAGEDAQGDLGVKQWFRRFVQLTYSQGREPGRAELPEMYEWKDFEKLMLWVHGETGQYKLNEFSDMWKTEGRRNGLIHNISYSGGDAKKKLEGLAYMTPDDLQHEKDNYTWSNIAETHMEQSVFDVAATLRAEYQEQLQYLREEMPDAAVRRKEYVAWLEKKKNEYKLKKKDGSLSKDEAKIIKGISLREERKAAGMRRDKYLEWLETRTKLGESLSRDETEALGELLTIRNNVNGGVNIRDQHMLNRSGPYTHLVKLQSQYDELTRSNSLSPEQTQLKQALEENIKAKWKEFTLNPNETFGAENRAELSAYGGFSPIEIETYRRVVADLKMQGIDNPPVWKMRDAILSARRSFIGSGRAVTIAANVAIMPALEYAPRGRDVMPAGFAEQLQRLENVELFMYRFSMGGKYGEASRALLDIMMLDQKGLKTDAAEILKSMRKDESKEARMARTAFAMASEAMGISFTELLRKKLLGSGFIFDGTTWRMDIAIMDQVRAKMLAIKQEDKLPADAALDNLALGIQLALAETEGHRRVILERMLVRTPSKFFQLLGGEAFDKVLGDKGLKLNSGDGQTFQRALSLVERRLWEEEEWRLKKDVNLADENQFKELFGKAFKVLGVDEAKGEKYRDAIEAMQKFVTTTENRPKKTSILEEWAKKKFPITLTLSDFDWKDTRFDFLSAYTHERRMINDQFPKLEAMGGFIEFMTTPEMLSPLDPEKTSLPKIIEIKKKVNAWATTSDAEDVAKMLSRIFYAFNQNRAATRSVWGWIPGAVTAMKNIGEWDLREDSLFGKVAIRLGVPEELLDHKIAHWPHSVSQAVSYSVRFTGAEGNAYDEFYMEHLLRHQQRIGTFTEHPEYVQDLRNEFKTGLLPRFSGTIRKYWWTVPAATIALAASQGLEEEQKKSH